MQQTSNLPAKSISSADMGLVSITSMLNEMSNNTVTGKDFISSLKENFDDLKLFVGESLTSLMPNFSQQYYRIKDKNNLMMNNIYEKLNTLVEYFLGQSTPNEKENNILPIKKEIEIKTKSKSETKSTFGLPEITEFIKTISSNLNKKLFNQMNNFNIALDKMISFDEKKVNSFDKGITKLNKVLQNLLIYVKPVAIGILALATGFYILGFAAKSPMLALGLLMLTGFVWLLSKALGKSNLPTEMIQFATGIGILVIAMMAIQYVPFVSILMLTGFILLLGFALRSDHKSGSVSGQMIQFATGIAILTLALFAFSEIPVGSILKMVGFIALLGLVMKLFEPKTFGPGPKISSILAFGLGLGILVLALFAFTEIPFWAMIKFLIFIAILGLEIGMINQTGSGVGKGMMGFAFGLGLLVLAMYAMNELPWQSLVGTLLFLGGLGLVLKLFGPKVGATMALVGAGILAISVALWIVKQTNFTLTDALYFAGSIIIISAVMLLLGIPAIAALVLTGSIAMVGMAVASALAALSLGLISVMPLDLNKILIFSLSVGILTLAFAAIAIPAVLGLVGAVLFIPIAVAALLGVLALTLISKLNIDNKKINNFGIGMRSLISAFNEIGFIAVTKAAVKSALILPIILVSMVAAKFFDFVGKIDIMKGTVNLMIMMGGLNLAMNQLKNWKNKNAFKSIVILMLFIEAIREYNNIQFKSITENMSVFINNLSDDKKWDKINKHLVTMAKNVKDIVTNINMLNLAKIFKFNETLKLLSAKDNTKNLDEVISKLREMIGLLYTNIQMQSQPKLEEKSIFETSAQKVGLVNTTSTLIKKQVEDDKNKSNMLTEFVEALELATLSVKIVDGTSNKVYK
jgi:hypothetical protein